MRNARLIVALALVFALGACHGKDEQNAQANQGISMDEGVPENQLAADNAQIETLPADESSTTPTNQLANGFDNPDVNDIGTTNSH